MELFALIHRQDANGSYLFNLTSIYYVPIVYRVKS